MNVVSRNEGDTRREQVTRFAGQIAQVASRKAPESVLATATIESKMALEYESIGTRQGGEND